MLDQIVTFLVLVKISISFSCSQTQFNKQKLHTLGILDIKTEYVFSVQNVIKVITSKIHIQYFLNVYKILQEKLSTTSSEFLNKLPPKYYHHVHSNTDVPASN